MMETAEINIAHKKHIIDILFDFIRVEDELNPVLCGYFCKLITNLLNSNRKQFCLYVFNPQNQIIQSMINHIYNRSIADLLVKILNQDVLKSDYQQEVLPFIMTDEDLKEDTVLHILDQIELHEFEGKLNAALVTNELIESMKNFSTALKSPKVNEKIFSLIESEDELTVRSAFQMLDKLYTKFPFYVKSDSSEEEDPFSHSLFNESKSSDDTIIPEINDLIIRSIPKVAEVIECLTGQTLDQQYGGQIKAFGYTRIEAVKFVKSIVKLGVVDYAIHFNATFSKLLEFSKQYPWNSALHKLTEEIFSEVLRSNSKYPVGFKTAFLEDTNLPSFIADLQAQSQFEASGRNMRTGNMGSFLVLANLLESNLSDYVKETVDNCSEWEKFQEGELYSSNFNNDQPLAGHQTATSAEEDDDSDDNHYETSMDRLFATFTSVKESFDSSRSNSEASMEDVSDEGEEEEKEEERDDDILEGEVRAEEEEEETEVPVLPEKYTDPEQPAEDEQPQKGVSPVDEEMEKKVEISSNYHDNNFWKPPMQMDLEALLKDNDFY